MLGRGAAAPSVQRFRASQRQLGLPGQHGALRSLPRFKPTGVAGTTLGTSRAAGPRGTGYGAVSEAEAWLAGCGGAGGCGLAEAGGSCWGRGQVSGAEGGPSLRADELQDGWRGRSRAMFEKVLMIT